MTARRLEVETPLITVLPPKPLRLHSTYSLVLEWQAYRDLCYEHIGHAYFDEFQRGLTERETALAQRLRDVTGLVGVGDDLAILRRADGSIEEVPLTPCRCIPIPAPLALTRDDICFRDRPAAYVPVPAGTIGGNF